MGEWYKRRRTTQRVKSGGGNMPPMQRPAGSVDFPWYDSLWLSAFESAKRIMSTVAPARLSEFERAFDIFRTSPQFEVKVLRDLLDERTLERLRSVADKLAPSQLEMHEARMFRRFVVHDHPEFTALQRELMDAVGAAAGEAVEPSYNFLSLYGPQGVCPLHMDSPQAKWTLDLCLRQSAPWEIKVGPVVPWPGPGPYPQGWDAEVRRALNGARSTFSLGPGEAILFSGSSQWHYRDPMPAGAGKAFCDLLFFHFIPAGTAQLVEPVNWARLFGVPELHAVIDKSG